MHIFNAMNNQAIILNKSQIEAKINRMVHQINELCHTESEVIICGIIPGNGALLTKRIAKKLAEVSSFKITQATITINKENPLKDKIECSISSNDYANKAIIVVDDVSNSAKTLMYASQYFIDQPVKSILPLVLVDRNHSRYPIRPRFVGQTISTTLQDHIHVEMNENDEAVYLVNKE